MPPDVSKVQDEKQKLTIERACVKVAAIVGSTLTKLSLNKALVGSGMDKILKYCDTVDEAKQFLGIK